MQSVIQNFAWYKVSYLQWNKVSYYFFSDVEWHTIAEILYLQEQEYQAPPVNLFFLLQTPTTWLFKDFLVPEVKPLSSWADQCPLVLPGLRILGGLPDPSRNFVLIFAFQSSTKWVYPQTPLVPSSQNLWFINRAVLWCTTNAGRSIPVPSGNFIIF